MRVCNNNMFARARDGANIVLFAGHVASAFITIRIDARVGAEFTPDFETITGFFLHHFQTETLIVACAV